MQLRHQGPRHQCVRMEASPTDLIVYATFDVSDSSTINKELVLVVLGEFTKYFDDFKQCKAINPFTWSFKLSEKGKSRFHGSAHAALTRIGKTIVM